MFSNWRNTVLLSRVHHMFSYWRNTVLLSRVRRVFSYWRNTVYITCSRAGVEWYIYVTFVFLWRRYLRFPQLAGDVELDWQGEARTSAVSRDCKETGTRHCKDKTFGRNISNTRDSVSSDFQTPRKELKIRRAAEYFWRVWSVLKCLDSRWNPFSSVSYIFWIETKTKE